MSSKITPYINNQNIQGIREQIARKKGNGPYLATIQQSSEVLTDYDTFPYPRWFRGVPNSSRPIVAEREAGWRPRHDSCYRVLEPKVGDENLYPNHCFQGPCSTTYPCYPEALRRYSDRNALEVILNRSCIPQYR